MRFSESHHGSLCPNIFSSEVLHESDELSKEARDCAALVASKVYYFLGEYEEALSFALGAGSAFDVETRVHGSEEFVETVVCMSLSVIIPADRLT